MKTSSAALCHIIDIESGFTQYTLNHHLTIHSNFLEVPEGTFGIIFHVFQRTNDIPGYSSKAYLILRYKTTLLNFSGRSTIWVIFKAVLWGFLFLEDHTVWNILSESMRCGKSIVLKQEYDGSVRKKGLWSWLAKTKARKSNSVIKQLQAWHNTYHPVFAQAKLEGWSEHWWSSGR